MPYFMMDGTRTDNNLDEKQFLELLKGHEALIRAGLASGTVLLAGPKTSAPGGYVILKAKDRAEAEAFFEQDPFKINGIQSYQFTEFRIHDVQDCLSGWVSK